MRKPSVAVIAKGESDIISHEFTSATRNIYSAARREYQPSLWEDPINTLILLRSAPETGKTLFITKEQTAWQRAEKIAKLRLRKINANENRASITPVGTHLLVAE